MLLFSCTQPEELIIETEEPTINIDSLADVTIQQVNKQKKQKVLLEQDLWRKKRDIKEIEKKFNESVYELNNLKLISEDSLVFDYKIVVKEIVDSVRITVSDSLCVNCREIQKKKENTLVSKAFKWFKNNIKL
jgi:formylmethanofuran dehydrogenase subunit E|tara:strand:- start:431 stop:829 length:399 start_codon:yes stop_codon:yes gene_type:complete